MVDSISYAQALVIIYCPHVSTASLSKEWGFRGVHRPTCSVTGTLSPWVLHGRLVYKYAFSIGNCAT